MRTPSLPLSAMVLPAPAVVPPTVLPLAEAIQTPKSPFFREAPAALVPTKLPSIRLLLAPVI
jgi:hypothetical protein